uniref:Uncharacterized protein n=1 Tax=Anguilla anguilla TaxID=7936 RepID=A0A0E9T7H8_ANGAN
MKNDLLDSQLFKSHIRPQINMTFKCCIY